jgi:hypothetical protein
VGARSPKTPPTALIRPRAAAQSSWYADDWLWSIGRTNSRHRWVPWGRPGQCKHHIHQRPRHWPGVGQHHRHRQQEPRPHMFFWEMWEIGQRPHQHPPKNHHLNRHHRKAHHPPHSHGHLSPPTHPGLGQPSRHPTKDRLMQGLRRTVHFKAWIAPTRQPATTRPAPARPSSG